MGEYNYAASPELTMYYSGTMDPTKTYPNHLMLNVCTSVSVWLISDRKCTICSNSKCIWWIDLDFITE